MRATELNIYTIHTSQKKIQIYFLYSPPPFSAAPCTCERDDGGAHKLTVVISEESQKLALLLLLILLDITKDHSPMAAQFLRCLHSLVSVGREIPPQSPSKKSPVSKDSISLNL